MADASIYMTMAEYARHQGVWPQTVSWWIRKGKIQKAPCGRIRWRKADRALREQDRYSRSPRDVAALLDAPAAPTPPRSRRYKKQSRIRVVRGGRPDALALESPADTAWFNPGECEW